MVFLYFSLYFKKISDIIDIIGNKNEMEYYGQVKQRKKNGDKDIMTMQEVQEMKQQLEQVFLLYVCWMEKYWKQERE